jgi:NitT/TauT family transport system substrate-binding protein
MIRISAQPTRRGRRGAETSSLALLACSLVLVLAVPAAAGTSAAPAGRNALTPVAITALPLEPTALAFYARDRGFFRRQGIDARITVLTDPAQAPAAILSRTAHFSSFSTGGLAILKSRGAPVKLVAAGAVYRPRAPTTAVVAAKGKRIGGARALVGKTVAIDAPNTPAHIGLLRWLKRNGVAAASVRLVYMPFAQMVGPLSRGTVDAAVVPEPFLTLVLQRGAKRIAHPFNAICSRVCLLTIWMARRDVDANLAARFRKAIQAAAVWANRKRNDRASGAILARYAEIDPALIRRVTRTRFATRLRPALAQPWIDVFAEFGVIPSSFSAMDLVK